MSRPQKRKARDIKIGDKISLDCGSGPRESWRFCKVESEGKSLEQEHPQRKPMCCPWCAAGSGLLLRSEKPIEGRQNGQAFPNDDDDAPITLTEHQCQNEDCDRSFWV